MSTPGKTKPGLTVFPRDRDLCLIPSDSHSKSKSLPGETRFLAIVFFFSFVPGQWGSLCQIHHWGLASPPQPPSPSWLISFAIYKILLHSDLLNSFPNKARFSILHCFFKPLFYLLKLMFKIISGGGGKWRHDLFLYNPLKTFCQQSQAVNCQEKSDELIRNRQH